MPSCMKNYHAGIGALFALLFFIAGVVTLSHYGINIDEPVHFLRGQAYFRLLTTGKKTYEGFESDRRSVWQIDPYGASYFLKEDIGHPPLNGILAAATNYLLYQKAGIMSDLESYHLFEVFISSLLVFLVFYITAEQYGIFAGFVAMLSLSLYPLFLGESHFNIKDPVEAAFFAFTIYFFYKGIRYVQARHIFISGIFCGFALGTKFNIVFVPFIVVPWLFIIVVQALYRRKWKIKKSIQSIPARFIISLACYPIIVIGILYISWPYLWPDPIRHLTQTVGYYSSIGSGAQGWSMYPAEFIGASTPEPIMVLSFIGVIAVLINLRKDRYHFGLLVLLWMFIPIVRVMRPGASIYSGVRQIMEYVPAMAILAGIGANTAAIWLYRLMAHTKFVQLYNHKSVKPLPIAIQVLIVLSFIPLALKLISIHPNENVYMNSFVGGLKGAMEKDLHGAGQSMGNVYLQGIWWLNEHAEEGARVALVFGGHGIIPDQYVSENIKFGPYSSGILRQGEYVMERISQDHPTYLFEFQFYDRFLKPVHVVEVDGVPILKIWKNSPEYLKPGFDKERVADGASVTVERDDERNQKYINIEVEKPLLITHVIVNYTSDETCSMEGNGFIYLSVNNKELQLPLNEDLFIYQTAYKYVSPEEAKDKWHYFFPAVPMKKLRVFLENQDSCLYNVQSVEIWRVEGKST